MNKKNARPPPRSGGFPAGYAEGPVTVLRSLTGSCFSSESALGPGLEFEGLERFATQTLSEYQ